MEQPNIVRILPVVYHTINFIYIIKTPLYNMASIAFYIFCIIPTIGTCDKLRNYHKCSDSTLKAINSPVLKNAETDLNVNNNIASTSNAKEDHLDLDKSTSTPFDFHYKTTSKPNVPFENSFIDNLAFSMSLEAYPTFPYTADFLADLSTSFKGYVSGLYKKIFNILNNLDDQISKDKYFEIYHLADAYF